MAAVVVYAFHDLCLFLHLWFEPAFPPPPLSLTLRFRFHFRLQSASCYQLRLCDCVGSLSLPLPPASCDVCFYSVLMLCGCVGSASVIIVFVWAVRERTHARSLQRTRIWLAVMPAALMDQKVEPATKDADTEGGK